MLAINNPLISAFCEIPYDEPELLWELEMVSNLQILSHLMEFLVKCCSLDIICLLNIWITSKKGGYEDNCEVDLHSLSMA